MKILVTGGAGFIGSHISEYHINKGDQVWIVDNLLTGKKANIELFQTSLHQFDQANLLSWEALKEAVCWADRIYHMAAIVGQKYVVKHPVEVLATNIKTCELILTYASQREKKPEVLIASSSGVYGEREYTQFCEETTLNIQSTAFLQDNYSISKIVNEMTALSYVYSHQVPCIIARIFNTIGTRQTGQYGMVVPSLIAQALSGKPLTIYGDGLQTRSFCHVHDTVRAFDLLLSNSACHGEIINIGNDREISILELAKLIIKQTNSSSSIVYVPYEKAYGVPFLDVRRRKPDLSKIRKLISFAPQFTLEEAIDEIAQFTSNSF